MKNSRKALDTITYQIWELYCAATTNNICEAMGDAEWRSTHNQLYIWLRRKNPKIGREEAIHGAIHMYAEIYGDIDEGCTRNEATSKVYAMYCNA